MTINFDRVPVQCPTCDCTTFISISGARYGVECGAGGIAQQDDGVRTPCGKFFNLSTDQKVEAILQWLDEL
jgi:hypothetical protein